MARTKSTSATQVAQVVVELPRRAAEGDCALPASTSTLRNGLELQHTAMDTLVHVLQRHARQRPDHRAFVYLRDDESEEVVMTYAQLDERARSIAAHLQQMHLVGERVLLAFPPGLDFIAGYFGCLYAGCVAVPVSLPRKRTLDRFGDIAVDAGARLVLSTAPAIAQFHEVIRRLDQTSVELQTPWLAVDDVALTSPDQWAMPEISSETLAMLQYTSGSTSQPKGVMISHGNLIQNTRDIHQAFEMNREVSVFWLPTHHDMGLVGGILEPIVAGTMSVLMAPSAFLQQPYAWLAAISTYRATITGAPNFAYDLCVRKITEEQRATLDLSCLSLAFIGAEPIQPETIERFAAAFAPCGFNPTAFYPCYGLAEATLMVSGATRSKGPTIRAFRKTALIEHRAEPAIDDAETAQRLVSCGSPVGELSVRIVDPETREEAASGCVGEIWISGASVGMGYWHKPAESSRTFDAHLDNTGAGPFLRTADLGFVFEGELYVIGRIDDVLIVRGLNYHPQDLEMTARTSHPLLEAGFGACFAVEDHERGRRLVLVHEVSRTKEDDFAPVMEAAREAILARHDLTIHSIVLVRGGTIPKTSSGKVQRRSCRALYMAGELKVLAERGLTATPDVADAQREPQSFVLATVCQHALTLGGAALSHVTPDTPLASLGLDSVQRVELAAMLEKTFTCRLPDNEFSPDQTLGELASAVQRHLNGHTNAGPLTRRIPRAHYDFAQFPEYEELKRYERMVIDVAGENPYFRVDQGGAKSAGIARIAERDLLNFCDYDYLGLAHDPDVAAATKNAIDRYGTSAGASRLVSGEKQVHRDLERGLAEFLGTAAAIVFVSGHATNVTTIGHLLGPEDLVVHDVLAHNSIMQGAQLSGATRRVFAHNDWNALDALLSEVRCRYRRVLIAIEGVYSMDGDYPDLPRFVELKKKHKALLLVDEAHSLGIMGATGRGIGEHWDIASADVDLWMGTLSKALASCGGYIAGSAELIEYLAYTAPGFVYSVGLSPPNAAAALAALNALKDQPHRVTQLRELSRLFLKLAKERGLNTGSAADTPVVPVIVANSVKSLRLARALFERGIYVQPILPPVVPEHASRLRFFITTNHSEPQIRETVEAIAEELAKL
jgi:8-amino-7-oxononanoate synthase